MSISPYGWSAIVTFTLLCVRMAHAQQSTVSRTEESAVGCYRLSLGSWSSQANIGPARSTTVIRLDTIALRPGVPGDLVARRVEPAEVVLPGDSRAQWQRPASWRREGKDSVVISLWSTGTESEVFMGHRSGATLQGVVRRISDAIPIDPETKKIRWDAWPFAAASAVPVPCP